MAEAILEDVASILGFKKPFESQLDLAPVIRRGLSSSALTSVSNTMGFTTHTAVVSLGLAPRTIARRIEKKQRLTPEESERFVRLARALAQATATLGTREKARMWLQRPSRALGRVTPLSMLDTDVGALAVLEELGRIEHGVFA